MTDENSDMTDEAPETTDPDVADALEATGYVESGDSDDEPDEDSKIGGIFDKISGMSGSGKDLDAYEKDPIASVFATEDGDIPRGAKHIARGVDGLSPVAAAHPLIDIGVGFVLLKAEGRIGDGGASTDSPGGPDEDGDDSEYRGDMLT